MMLIKDSEFQSDNNLVFGIESEDASALILRSIIFFALRVA